MPPRATGQLDQISQAIGRLEAAFEGIDRYTHDREHAINNLSQKVDGLGSEITRQIAATEARIGIRLDSMDRRVAVLEADKDRREGALGVGTWFVKHGASLGAIIVGVIVVIIIVLRVTGQLP